jgi:hypothetical protein
VNNVHGTDAELSPACDGGADLTSEELEVQQSAELPDRAALSLVNANLAVPINLGAALNVLSDGSTAEAGAIQQDPIAQGI